MQQKIKRLQAQLGDLKGKCKDTLCVSDTQNQLFKIVSDQKDNTQDSSKNTKFAKQPIAEILPKIGETKALSKPVTSNSVSTPPVSKGVNNDKVIAPGMFRISPDKTTLRPRTKPITVSQPSVITMKGMNSNSNGLSSTGLDNTKTRSPHPRSNTKNDRVLSASKSSRSKNKEVKVEEHHRNLLLSKKNKHMSSACNSSKIDSQDVISKVVCAKCKKCLNSVNHDVCLNNYVNGKKSRGRKQKAKVSFKEIQMTYRPKVSKPKNVGRHESLTTPKPRKPRFLLRWSPTGKMFDSAGKLVAPSGCSKHMTGNLKLLINFVWKFMGTVRFGNDHVAAILGFGQFCDLDLEVAFRRNDCFVRNLEGVDLLKGDHDYSCYTLVHFLRSKDEAPEVIITFLKRITVLLQSPVIIIRTDNATEFKNQVLKVYFDSVGISHQMSLNDREDIGMLGAKGDIGFFIGYSADCCAYRIYNR
nr:hypothetical protein [Tanacetum cinerariifolium]